MKEGHEKAIGKQLLRALKLDGKFLRHGEDDGEPDLIYRSTAKPWGLRSRLHFITMSRPKSNRSWRWASSSQVDLAHRLVCRMAPLRF